MHKRAKDLTSRLDKVRLHRGESIRSRPYSRPFAYKFPIWYELSFVPVAEELAAPHAAERGRSHGVPPADLLPPRKVASDYTGVLREHDFSPVGGRVSRFVRSGKRSLRTFLFCP